MIKRIAFLLALSLCFALCACGNSDASSTIPQTKPQSTDAQNALSGNEATFNSPAATPEDTQSESSASVQIYDEIAFGSYEQGNGVEPITWIVLHIEDNRALLVSKNALEVRQYHGTKQDMTWENCDLRVWLNSDFMNTAFTAEEQRRIPLVTVSASANGQSRTDPGNSTDDRVFLLSASQADFYFSSDEARVCYPTSYAATKIPSDYLVNGCCFWGTRTPGRDQTRIATVDYEGFIGYGGLSVVCTYLAVRPAMWLEIGG